MTLSDSALSAGAPSREQLLHSLYEAAELEHNLMCTYLYAAFSLRQGTTEGLTAAQAEATARWRRSIIDVAIAEMSHLVAVWNITAALGGMPRFGRTNFPLDPGYLPAGVVVKLAPFNRATLQHFIHLERPAGSDEPDGEGFAFDRSYLRATASRRLTPMATDYATVGEFYATLTEGLRRFVDAAGEEDVFCGDRALQLSQAEVDLPGARRVLCLKTAVSAFDAIVLDGEGAPSASATSHFQSFVQVRSAYDALLSADPQFSAAWPAATNPVLRRPPRPEGRVWLESPAASATVDVANAAYGLMLRLLGQAYATVDAHEKAAMVDLGIGLMRAMTSLGEAAARLPAGPSNPHCNAGMSFTALRDAAPLPHGAAARRFIRERLHELTAGARTALDTPEVDVVRPKIEAALRQLHGLATQADRVLVALAAPAVTTASAAPVAAAPPVAAPASLLQDGREIVEGEKLTLSFETKRCIHARFCVTGAPKVFLANVQGPWIHPDAMDVERLVEIAHACPSGAIQYRRKDGGADEAAPPVNLAAVREAGPYAFRGALVIDGAAVQTRATLCRCGASKNKPYCDGSHHAAQFSASGEPPSGETAMLPVRDGPMHIDPQTDGPLQVRGNLEIVSGTGRVVARVTSARLCRCGGSANKPFCDGTHARIGFTSRNS